MMPNTKAGERRRLAFFLTLPPWITFYDTLVQHDRVVWEYVNDGNY